MHLRNLRFMLTLLLVMVSMSVLAANGFWDLPKAGEVLFKYESSSQLAGDLANHSRVENFELSVGSSRGSQVRIFVAHDLRERREIPYHVLVAGNDYSRVYRIDRINITEIKQLDESTIKISGFGMPHYGEKCKSRDQIDVREYVIEFKEKDYSPVPEYKQVIIKSHCLD